MAEYEIKNGVGIIPEGTTEIKMYAFRDCEELSSIVIPDSVTEIGDRAFSGCTGLKSIVIPNSVTEIGWNAFKGCTGLTSIVIPDSVTEIGYETFSGCTSLQSIVIPDSVKEILYGAFKDCIGLTDIVIPTETELEHDYEAEMNAFEGCSNLKSIVVAEGNPRYDSRNNCNAIIKSGQNKLVVGCKNTVIPNTVTSIGYNAFRDCTGLTSIVIPESVKEIENYRRIKELYHHGRFYTNVELAQPFFGCKNLTSIIVAEGNPVFDSRENCNAIIDSDNDLVVGCKNTVIPDSVRRIWQKAFSGTELTEAIIPDSVVAICEYAFERCENLKNVVLGKSVESIKEKAFANCISLESIFIPENVSWFSDDVFSGCSKLSKITVSEENEEFDSRDNCNAVILTSENTLKLGCAGTVIPDSVPIIGDSAFWRCDRLSSIDIPSSVTEIFQSAFRECGLENVVIPETVTTIGQGAFYRCNKLKTVSVLGPVKKLDSTFGLCHALETVTLGPGIKKIEHAFDDCPSLRTIYVPAKKAKYYMSRLPEELHHLIVELPAEKGGK